MKCLTVPDMVGVKNHTVTGIMVEPQGNSVLKCMVQWAKIFFWSAVINLMIHGMPLW